MPPARPLELTAQPAELTPQHEDTVDLKEVELDETFLSGERIVSHNAKDPRTRAYDLLRTQILRSMDLNKWQILAVTSPTAGCGKTLTAINLALSIARLKERPVLVVDADLMKPQVASRLGFRFDAHLLALLEGRAHLRDALIQARFLDNQIMVLPAKPMTSGSAEWLASRAMATLLQEIKNAYPACTVIIDLPPVLGSDDVMAILPQIDNLLLVAASGMSTTIQIEECYRHLQSIETRIVLNKSKDTPITNYGY